MSITKQIEREFSKYCGLVGYKIPMRVARCLEGRWATTYRIGRGRKCAFVIEFSRKHLSIYPDHIRNTVIHEIAHVVSFIEKRHWGHGAPWKKIVKRMGGKPIVWSYCNLNG